MDISRLISGISGAAGVSPNNLVGLLSVGAMVLNRLPGLHLIRDNVQSFNIDLSTLATCFMVATAIWTSAVFLYGKFWALVDKHYSCSIRLVRNTHGPMYNDFHAWLSDVKGADIRGVRKYDLVPRLNDGHDAPPTLQLYYQISPDAEYSFRHNGHNIRINKAIIRGKIGDKSDGEEITTLTTYGRSQDVLKGLLQDVLTHTEKSRQGMTAIFKPSRMNDPRRLACWQLVTNRPHRSITSVVLEGDQKAKILADIEEYLLPPTKRWYANRGLPYRRGYLLYGPPGTGKTSLSMALAAHCNLNIYALSLTQNGLDDERLGTFFSELPMHCIVLLEDIDASGVRRANDSSAPTTEPPAPSSTDKNKDTTVLSLSTGSNSPKTKVTFSGLINAIDGATASEGRILIMTTNHREHLDEALIRPGRVDLQVGFAYASRSVIISLFESLYDVNRDDLDPNYIPADFPEKKEVKKLAVKFADIVPEERFTPAEVQGLLLVYKKDPKKAVAMAPAWVEKRLMQKEENEMRQKAEKASVDSS